MNKKKEQKEIDKGPVFWVLVCFLGEIKYGTKVFL